MDRRTFNKVAISGAALASTSFTAVAASKPEPLYTLRRADERGLANHGWLKSRHTFSFANYYDPAFMGFSELRVINEDIVQAGRGFGKHPHRDMEILSYVLDGQLEHKDSMGTGSIIEQNDVQLMSAGSGVAHSEFNASATQPVHFLQIWIQPNVQGATPSYQQKRIPAEEKRGQLRLILSPDGAKDSLLLRQDARVYAGLFNGAESAELKVAENRKVYIHLVRGSLSVNGLALQAGDGLMVEHASELAFKDGFESEVLVFDLP